MKSIMKALLIIVTKDSNKISFSSNEMKIAALIFCYAGSVADI